eukprot:1389883-Ditylum_brightwellii.AAC.2
MVESIENKIVNNDTTSVQGTIDQTSLQQTINKHIELSMPSIIETTINQMLQNKLLDKNISTTVGTTVSTMIGDMTLTTDDNTKTTLITTPTDELTTSETEEESNMSSTYSSSQHQRRISARTRAKNKCQGKNVQFQTPPPTDPGENSPRITVPINTEWMSAFHQKSANMQRNLNQNEFIGDGMLHKEEHHTWIFVINPN